MRRQQRPSARHALHLFPGRFTNPGAVPGDLTADPARKGRTATLVLTRVDGGKLEETPGCTLDDVRRSIKKPCTTWLHIQGTPGEDLLREIGEICNIHRLALEDVLHTGQRAKLELSGDQIFVVMGIAEMTPEGLCTSQISLFLGESWVVSFCSGDEDPFPGVRKRMRDENSRIRSNGPDYLFYSLLDTAVDLYFPVIETLGERIEELETTVFDDPSRGALDRIQRLKRELVLLRRMLWPQRDMLDSLMRGNLRLISDDCRLYLRDCYDHSVHALDLVESYREMASSLLEVYLSSLSNRMNDIMKVLTIIATVFIPLSFITGLYGMNFDRTASRWNMPELGAPYGYPVLLLFMAAVVVLMLVYFRRKGWF